MSKTDDSKAAAADSGVDYKSTLALPKTDFPMRAGLPKKEPEWLERWAKMDIYGQLRQKGKDGTRETFSYHEGPPYANGEAHMGHALNRILKDMVVRSQQMMGKDVPFVPGWDCHGLPIEWKIEEKYRKAGKNKDEVPIADFLQECRDFANHWIDVQKEVYLRLGNIGEWDNPYKTMDFGSEATIVREFHKFVEKDLVVQGSKPVMWSAVERTALAEAEVEYHDKISSTIWVGFPVVEGPDDLIGTEVLIYTTTPWTIPANRGIAYNDSIAYGIYEIKSVGEEALAEVGKCYVLADSLAPQVAEASKIEEWTRLGDGPSMSGVKCSHPFRGQGYDFEVPLIPGDHVTQEEGTGFVHTAPSHGADDYIVGQKFGLEVPHMVDENGIYYDDVPLFGGKTVIHADGKKAGKFGDANSSVIEVMKGVGALVGLGHLEHSYPHSWRSKAPLIFRNTVQWFIALDKPVAAFDGKTLRELALSEIDRVEWFPAKGQARIRAMVANRPDWVISRQRSWGVPLAVFVSKSTGEILKDPAVTKRISDAIEQDGTVAWFTSDSERFLGNEHAAEDYDRVDDILDVWFDSASTHAFVLDGRDDLQWPANLYLEGSDQHRGWFQSSLLQSCGTRGRAPYDQVLTHGFILDDKGFKMAKSGGNAMSPEKLTKQFGAEIIRLWAASSDYRDDLTIGDEVVKGVTDAYRKLRNTMRFMLGNLDGFSDDERIDVSQMPELERLMLSRLQELDVLVRQAYTEYDFPRVFHTLFNFATTELSAFYFDIRKDALYCDRADSVVRRSCRTVVDETFRCLTTWLAPMMCFTMEEVWLSRFPGDENSVHLQDFPEVPAVWADAELTAKWEHVKNLRRVVTGALEVERREKRIGSSLEAAPQVFVSDASILAAMAGIDVAEVVITSQATLSEGEGPGDAFRLDDVPGVAVVPGLASGDKCQRSWKILPDVGSNPDYPTLSARDADAVAWLKENGEVSVGA